MRVEQAAPLIGGTWPGQAETVGGRVVEALRRVPEPGEEIDIDGTHVEVEAVDGGAVTSVIVGQRPAPEGEESK
jgi:CBS domain containing-hemolysin-like protein